MISFIIHVYFYLVVFQNRFSLVSIHNLFIDNFRTNIFRKQSSKFIQSTLQFSYTLRLNTLHGNEFFCGIIPDLCTLPIAPVPATTNHSFFVIVCNFSRKRRFRLIRSDWPKIFSPLLSPSLNFLSGQRCKISFYKGLVLRYLCTDNRLSYDFSLTVNEISSRYTHYRGK